MPAIEIIHCIRSGDKEKLRTIEILPKLRNRIHRIGRSGSLEFNVRYGKIRILLHGARCHSKPVLRRSGVYSILMGRTRGWNKNDLIQGGSRAYHLCRDQMPDVNGVKGSPHDSNAFRHACSPHNPEQKQYQPCYEKECTACIQIVEDIMTSFLRFRILMQCTQISNQTLHSFALFSDEDEMFSRICPSP